MRAGHFKRRLDEAVKLRIRYDFAAIKYYQAFLDTVIELMKAVCLGVPPASE